ncbi:Uncharacterised protein g9995 [Pycnogonum litorale]
MTNYDPECYSKFNGHSYHKLFLDTLLPAMNWTTNENVIDIGCGPGPASVNVLWPRIKQHGVNSLTCIDCCKDMVHWAKTNYVHRDIAFHEADIGDVDSIPSEWTGKFDKCFSFYALQDVPNFGRAFGNVHKLLKQTGEIAFLFESRSPISRAQKKMLQNEKWKNVLNASGYPNISCTEGIYGDDIDIVSSLNTLLKQCCFEPRSIKEVNSDRYFSTAKEFADVVVALDANKKKIPKEMLEEYTSDFYAECVKVPYMEQEGTTNTIINPIDGSHVFFERVIFLHAVKI